MGEGFLLDSTQNLASYTLEELKEYSVIVALNAQPSGGARKLFEQYMEEGGGWLGFHASAYNDRHTDWPWFVRFLGGGVFKCNNWPPQPALLETDNGNHPVTKNLPASYVAPASEFYQWEEDLRAKEHIQVQRAGRRVPVGVWAGMGLGRQPRAKLLPALCLTPGEPYGPRLTAPEYARSVFPLMATPWM